MAETPRPTALQWLAQVVFYIAAAALIGFFASRPYWQHFPDGAAQIKLSFSHGAKRKGDCRRFTAKEIAALPPSKRRPSNCARDRLPVVVQLLVDGKLVYGANLPPSGIGSDGPSRTYQKFKLPAGRHMITARLRDSDRQTGYDYETTKTVEFAPLTNLAIDFRSDQGGFVFK